MSFIWPDVDAVCAEAAAFMAEYGHEFQARDTAGLGNLLGRARQYADSTPEAHAALIAAVMIQSITQAHVLVDGNKRLAFLFGYVFLRLNGLALDMRETGADSAHAMVVGLVEKRLTAEDVAAIIRANC